MGAPPYEFGYKKPKYSENFVNYFRCGSQAMYDLRFLFIKSLEDLVHNMAPNQSKL